MRQAGDVTYADAHKTRKNEGVVEFACKGVSINMSMIITRADCFVLIQYIIHIFLILLPLF